VSTKVRRGKHARAKQTDKADRDPRVRIVIVLWGFEI